MKLWKKIVMLAILIIAGFLVWYQYTYSMDPVVPFTVNSPQLETKVLIASQGSRFKDSLVQGILRNYTQDPIFF